MNEIKSVLELKLMDSRIGSDYLNKMKLELINLKLELIRQTKAPSHTLSYGINFMANQTPLTIIIQSSSHPKMTSSVSQTTL